MMLESGNQEKGPIRVSNVAIVGAGPGCITILEMVRSDAIPHMKMNIVAIADINLNAPALPLAKEMGVELITTNYRDLFAIDDLDTIIELTGDDQVREAIEKEKPPSVSIIDHKVANLFWSLYAADQEKIRSQLQAKRQIDQEKGHFKQIFDSLLDEVLVIDKDMVIMDVNQTYLTNSGLTREEVIGNYCYEVGSRLRGDCQISVDYCGLQKVLQTGKATKQVYEHMNTKTGRMVYCSTKFTPLKDDRGEIIGVIEASRDITDRVELEEELIASKVQLEKFLDAAPFFISLKNTQGQYIRINKKVLEALQKPFEDIIAKTDLEILPKDIAEDIRQKDKIILTTRKELVTEDMIPRGDKPFYYYTVRFPIFDHRNEVLVIATIARNITALKEAEIKLQKKTRELEETKEYLQNILENSADIIITTDLDYNIVSFNAGAENLLGYKRDQVQGTPLRMLYANEDSYLNIIRRVEQEGAITNFETEMVSKDNKRLVVSLTQSRLIDKSGQPIGMVSICRDITAQKEFQRQLICQDRLVAIGKLSAGLAHELNNPLAISTEAIGWIKELIEEEKEQFDKLEAAKEIADGLDRIARMTKRCKDIIHRLLGFASQRKERIGEANVNDVLDEVTNFMLNVTRLANIKIHKDYQPEIPPINISVIQLQQVFVNIIDNAIDAIERNGNIYIKTYTENDNVIVSITDDGKGIPAELLPEIFDPFLTTKPVGEGTGLGLSIVYGIVNQFGGSINVDSEVEKGTTFHVKFPVKQANTQ